MTGKQSHSYLLVVGLLAIAVWCPGRVFAASITVPLVPTSRSGPNGEYLSADFDFGTAFSRIESLALVFTIPSGFEGSASTTGNSSYFRTLNFVLFDSAAPIPNTWAIGPEKSATRSVFSVPAAVPTTIGIGGLSYSFDGVAVDPTWPDFVFSGRGRLAFIDMSESFYHPLPDGVTLSSSTTWLPPTGITGATLTIEGTPVPEPPSYKLAAIGIVIFATGCSARRRVEGGWGRSR